MLLTYYLVYYNLLLHPLDTQLYLYDLLRQHNEELSFHPILIVTKYKNHT